MPTNSTTAAIIAALAPIIAAVVVLFKLDLTQDQQAEIVAGLAAIVTVAAAIYASVIQHSNAKIVASANQLATAQIQNLPPDGDDSIVPPKAR